MDTNVTDFLVQQILDENSGPMAHQRLERELRKNPNAALARIEARIPEWAPKAARELGIRDDINIDPVDVLQYLGAHFEAEREAAEETREVERQALSGLTLEEAVSSRPHLISSLDSDWSALS